MPRKLVFDQSALPETPKPNAKPKALSFSQTALPESAKVAPAARGPTTFAMHGQSKTSDLDSYIAAAKALDPTIASDHMFLPRLRLCLSMKPMEWINWGHDRIEILQKSASAQVNVNIAFNDLQVARWCDDAREQASKKPGMFDLFQPKVTPEFYDAQLTRIRAELETLAKTVGKAIDDLKPKMTALMLDNIIFQVVSRSHTDPTAMQIADGRLRTILTSLQMGVMAEQSLNTTLGNITTNIQQIDTVRFNVIPAWRVAATAQNKP